MAVAISGTSPAAVNNTTNTLAAVATASFTPPANSLLVVMWVSNTNSLTDSPATPTITDNLGTHLTYTLSNVANPSTTSTTTIGGQAAIWTAPVLTSSAMTVTVTNQAVSGKRQAGLLVKVLTGAELVSPVSTHGVGTKTPAGSVFSQSYTPQANGTGGMGFMCLCDWNNNTSAVPTQSTGCTRLGGVSQSTGITYAWIARTTGDDVAGTPNSLGVSAWASPDVCLWAWADITPPLPVTKTSQFMPFFM